MAKLIHGNDAYTALEIAQRSAGGATDPTYPDEYMRVPFTGESMTVQRDQQAISPEITKSGAITTLSHGPGHWRGTFTTLCYYNAPWMHWLLNQLMGGCEWLTLDRLPNDTTCPPGDPAGNGNTHTYIPQSFRCTTAKSIGAITNGIALRMTKMGPDNAAVNTGIEKVLGAYITEATFTHQLGSWPTMTWTVEGPEPTLIDGTGVTPLASAVTHYPVKPGDLSMAPSHPVLASYLYGWGSSSIYIDQFTMRVSTGLKFPPRSLNDLDTEHNIGHVSGYEVSCDVRVKGKQEDFDDTTGNPNWLWAGSIDGIFGWVMRYISAPSLAAHNPPQTPVLDAANNVPYCFEIDVPRPILTAVSEPIESGGALQLTYSFRGRNHLWGTGAAPNTDKRTPVAFQLVVNRADEPSVDTKFSANYGGNDPHTTLDT